MRIRFSGAEAEEHRLEAYEGLKSLDALVRVATIAAHYGATGEVRFRAPYSSDLEVHLSAIRNGSFEFIFDQVSRFADVLEGAKARGKSEAVFSRLVARGTGQAEAAPLDHEGEVIPAGDIDSMAEASEAALKGAHRWIDGEGKSIAIIDGEDATELDLQTKEYVETEVTGPELTQDVSVAALNVNNRTGRVYFFDEGRTIPFTVSRDAEARTIANLSSYLNQYANNTGATVNIRFRKISQLDGRIKRVIIFDCFDVRGAA